MKNIILIILASLLCSSINAQTSIKEGIKLIEKQYGSKFIYDSSLKTNFAYKGNLLSGRNLQDDLTRLFYRRDISWSLKDNYILLKEIKNYSLGGVVRDAESGETLAGATIINQSAQTFDYTNGQGLFSLNTKASLLNITCHYIGYETATIKINVNQDTLIRIDMIPSKLILDEIVVSYNGSEPQNMRVGKVNETGAVSININELKYAPSFSGGQDIFKYLQMIPGVSAGNDGSSNLYIRGGMADQTQILLDDVPIYNQSHAFGYVSIFSAEAVKSAVLHKGYTSPYYGGRLSGVVDMRMRDGNRYEHKQSLQLGLTTFSANVEGPISKGRGSYLLSGRIFSMYPFLKLGYSLIPKSKKSGAPTFNFFDITGKITYDLNDKNIISLSSYSGSDYFGVEYYDGYSSIEVGESTSKSSSSMNWGNNVASLRLNTIINSKMFMNNTLYYSYLGNRVSSDYLDIENNRSYNANISARMDEIGYKSNFDYNISSLYSLDFGTQLSHQGFSPQKMTSQIDGGVVRDGSFSNRSLSTYAVYANNNISLSKFDIDLGVRAVLYDNNSKVQYAVEPRVSISYLAHDNISIWGAYTRNNQPLFSLSKHYYSVPIDYWAPYVDNKLQSSDQYTIGVRQGANSAFSITAEIYYKRTKNLTMIYDSDEFLLNGEGYDHGEGEAYGAEIMAQYNLRRFSIVGSYSYSKSDITIDDNRQPYAYDTPHSASLLTMYRVINNDKRKHVLSLNIAYKSGKPYPMSNELYDSVYGGIFNGSIDVIHYSQFSTIRLKDYFRADISYSMEKVLRKGSRIWQVSITNLTNYKNPYIILSVSDADIAVSSQRSLKAFTLVPILPSFSYTRIF